MRRGPVVRVGRLYLKLSAAGNWCYMSRDTGRWTSIGQEGHTLLRSLLRARREIKKLKAKLLPHVYPNGHVEDYDN